jgi:protein O-GlcNAc transferase
LTPRTAEAGGTAADDRGPGQRLRVVYVSPDFRAHPVATMFEPVLANHERLRFESVVYSAVADPDHVTDRLKGYGGLWRDVRRIDDAALAGLIRADRIDVLVDLAGHTAGSRLSPFSLRPSPVQVTAIGYPDTTGLPDVDFHIADAWHDPPGVTDSHHVETLVQLPGGCWCYRPDGDEPDVLPLLALAAGRVTLGQFKRTVKVNPFTVRAWAAVLDAVPGSRRAARTSRCSTVSTSAWTRSRTTPRRRRSTGCGWACLR